MTNDFNSNKKHHVKLNGKTYLLQCAAMGGYLLYTEQEWNCADEADLVADAGGFISETGDLLTDRQLKKARF